MDAGGKALPLLLDVRDDIAIKQAVTQAAEHFGGINICINNASAISLAKAQDIEAKRFDLIQQINMRGTFMVPRASLPLLRKSENPHVLVLSPPLTMRADWFAEHLAHTLSKYGISMVMFGMAEEFRAEGIAFNALWPKTTIAIAAVEFALGGDAMIRRSRRPEIMADAAHRMLTRKARDYSGNFVLDENLLRAAGQTDFAQYHIDPEHELEIDIFVDPDLPAE
ncbi:SDR family oxidoreductase [Altericroceibacterium spongiae]|uniref:SDR family oxidoreductase n=1 Tax=Altericroceibacterium spongiae TaxID=2320269 RepID=UPI0026936571